MSRPLIEKDIDTSSEVVASSIVGSRTFLVELQYLDDVLVPMLIRVVGLIVEVLSRLCS